MTTPRRAGRQGGGDLPPPLIIILCRTLIIIPRRAGQGSCRFPPGSAPVRRERTQGERAAPLADRWAGILHTCLHRGQLYDETAAWQHLDAAAA